MGQGTMYYCKNCGHKFSLMLGIGMLDYPEQLLNLKDDFNILSRCKNANMQNFDELKKFLEKKDVVLLKDYADKPFICEKCNIFTSKFDFTLMCNSDNTTFTPKYICESCQSKLKLVDIKELNHLTCPKCHKNDIVEESFIDWD